MSEWHARQTVRLIGQAAEVVGSYGGELHTALRENGPAAFDAGFDATLLALAEEKARELIDAATTLESIWQQLSKLPAMKARQ